MRVTGSNGSTSKDTKIYTGLGRTSLRPVRALCSCTQMFAVGVTNGREREQGSQGSGSSVCVCVCVKNVDPLHEARLPPFIAQGVRIYREERDREGKNKGRGSGDSRPPFGH